MADGRESLKLTEFEDLEMLAILEEVARANSGWATAIQIAEAVGLGGRNPTRSVGSRLGWMRRCEVTEYDRNRGRWRVTPYGIAVLRGTLTQAQRKAIQALGDDRLLAMTREFSSRLENADLAAATLMNRQWRFGVAQRRRP